MSNANQPIFPTQEFGESGRAISDLSGGLTKREYMATQIAAAIAGTGPGWPTHQGDGVCIAQMAVQFADALLTELAKPKS